MRIFVPSALALLLAGQLLTGHANAAPKSRLAEIKDEDTKAWWALTEQLSSDDMQGRDTGSPAYQKAADIVARRFAAAGLLPAGENGTFFQTVPLREVEIEARGGFFAIERTGGPTTVAKKGLFGMPLPNLPGLGAPAKVEPLQFLHEITVRPTDTLPTDLEAPLVFRGYCDNAAMTDVKDKVVICFDTRRAGMATGAERVAAASKGGALGVIQVDDPLFTLEPPRWPEAYARTITFKGAPINAPKGFAIMRASDEAFAKLIDGTGRNARQILDDGGHQKGLETFDIPARLKAHMPTTEHELTSPNVIGLLPGSDPKLKGEVVVLSAHLDGYGHGEAVRGDDLYNGALDDAAYVALLVREADRLKAQVGSGGKSPRRSILFCAFTGEEKGLLGAIWFTHNPVVVKSALAADINLDQLRPLFPLKILTVHALGDTTLGDDVKAVATPMGIEVRPDFEPERNLVRRADHWPFLQIGVPATGFIFGYDPHTDAEKRYRQWYEDRYHRPQDDISQPIDFNAAKTFDALFYALVERVTNAEARPSWKDGSALKPK